MANKINPFWIIGGVLLVVLIFSQVNTQSVKLQSTSVDPTKAECEEDRNEDLDESCVTECIQITESLCDCAEQISGTCFFGSDEFGDWAYFHDMDDTCVNIVTRWSNEGSHLQTRGYLECAYGLEPQQDADECNVLGESSCIDSNTIKRCEIAVGGTKKWLEQDCGTNELCTGGECIEEDTDTGNGDEGNGDDNGGNGDDGTDSTLLCSDGKIPQFWQDLENDCEIFPWIIWVAVGLGVLMILPLLTSRRKR